MSYDTGSASGGKQTADHGHKVAQAGLGMAANALAKIHGQIMSAPDPNAGGASNDDLMSAIQGMQGGGGGAPSGGSFPSLDPAVQQNLMQSQDPQAISAYMHLAAQDVQSLQQQQEQVVDQWVQQQSAPQGQPMQTAEPPGVGGEQVQ